MARKQGLLKKLLEYIDAEYKKNYKVMNVQFRPERQLTQNDVDIVRQRLVEDFTEAVRRDACLEVDFYSADSESVSVVAEALDLVAEKWPEDMSGVPDMLEVLVFSEGTSPIVADAIIRSIANILRNNDATSKSLKAVLLA